MQIPCIERCAYGAVKAWTGYCIASEEIPEQRRVDLDTTIAAMALTAKEMNSKYKETSEGGLAVSLVLCSVSGCGGVGTLINFAVINPQS